MSASQYVVPPVKFSHVVADTRCRAMLSKSSYYFSHYWWTTKKGFPAAGVPNIVGDYREPASAATAMALVADYGAYLDSASGGVNLDLNDIRLRAAKLVVGTSNKHLLYTSGGWGGTWQSAYWAYLNGFAGWLVWDSQLTNQPDRDRLADTVVYEADFQLYKHRPEFWKDQYGNVLPVSGVYSGGPQGYRTGDSAIEENLWNATVLDFAATMMPGHPHAALWARRAAQYSITGLLNPANCTDTSTKVNGYSPNAWATGAGLGFGYDPPETGYNIDQYNLVTNHNKKNPDYMQAAGIPLALALHRGYARSATPEAHRFNASKVYGAMETVFFTNTTPYKAMYQSLSTPTLYFPEGPDWGIARHAGYWGWDSLVETMVTGVNHTSTDIPTSPTRWDAVHGNASKSMQDRTGVMPGGQIVLNDTEDSYSGREGWHALWIAYVYMNKALTNAGRISWTNSTL